MSDCRVCGTRDDKKPQIFRNESWCCDNHRKIILGELEPTPIEWRTMDKELYDQLGSDNARWKGLQKWARKDQT